MVNVTMITTNFIYQPAIYELLPTSVAERLYQVSRDLYAPVLAAFAVRCLNDLRAEPGAINVCLARDGISAFLAQRTLLRVASARFPGVSPRQVQLVYLSRQLVRDKRMGDLAQALMEGYLYEHGARHGRTVTLIDIGIHGSIQDHVQRWYPTSPIRGHYLIYRRRAGDPNATRKCGFLVGNPLAEDEASFLRREVIHLLEDLWSGVYESVTTLQSTSVPNKGTRICPALKRLGTSSPLRLPAVQLRRLKRVALQGVVDGVERTACLNGKDLFEPDACGNRDSARAWSASHARRLVEWIVSTRQERAADAWLWRTLIRSEQCEQSGSAHHNPSID